MNETNSRPGRWIGPRRYPLRRAFVLMGAVSLYIRLTAFRRFYILVSICAIFTGCNALTVAQQVSQIGERQGHEMALDQQELAK